MIKINKNGILSSTKQRRTAIAQALLKYGKRPKYIQITGVEIEAVPYRDHEEVYCFRTESGWGSLTLSIPDVYGTMDSPYTEGVWAVNKETYEDYKGITRLEFYPQPSKGDRIEKQAKLIWGSYWVESEEGDLLPCVENPPTWEECLRLAEEEV